MKRAFITIFLAACSSSAPAGNDAGNDAAAAINGCTTFTDMTASGATITGPSGTLPAQYAPACVQIKVGQSVTWNSNFASHPLVPTPSVGTQPNPITATASGTTVTVKFDNAGTYAFNCGIHSTTMLGAVEVTP